MVFTAMQKHAGKAQVHLDGGCSMSLLYPHAIGTRKSWKACSSHLCFHDITLLRLLASTGPQR